MWLRFVMVHDVSKCLVSIWEKISKLISWKITLIYLYYPIPLFPFSSYYIWRHAMWHCLHSFFSMENLSRSFRHGVRISCFLGSMYLIGKNVTNYNLKYKKIFFSLWYFNRPCFYRKKSYTIKPVDIFFWFIPHNFNRPENVYSLKEGSIPQQQFHMFRF